MESMCEPDLEAMVDPEWYEQHGPPWVLWDRLRTDRPICRVGLRSGESIWALTSYRGVREVTRRNDVFQNSDPSQLYNEYGLKRGDIVDRLGPDLLELNGGEHSRLRPLLTTFFTRSRVVSMRSFIGANVQTSFSALSTRLAKGEEVDFVAAVATMIPMSTICRMVGIPPTDINLISSICQSWVHARDFVGSDGPSVVETINRGSLELENYLKSLICARRRDAMDDLVSALCHGATQYLISDQEIAALCAVTLIGGAYTTRDSISHLMSVLLLDRDAGTRLAGDLSLVDSGVEEVLRHASPINHFVRTLGQSVTLDGVHMCRGDKVCLFYAAANRDPSIFPNPHLFDVMRDANRHLAFGGLGSHHCLGAHLAREQLRAVIPQMCACLPGMEISRRPTLWRSLFFNGAREMFLTKSHR